MNSELVIKPNILNYYDTNNLNGSELKFQGDVKSWTASASFIVFYSSLLNFFGNYAELINNMVCTKTSKNIWIDL